MEMKKCTSCGNYNLLSMLYCGYCGKPFSSGKIITTFYALNSSELSALTTSATIPSPASAPEANPAFSSINDFIIENKVLRKYIGHASNIIIPKGVISISYASFFYCNTLIDVFIPNSVKNIGYAAFLGCSSLTSVFIPKSVTSIGDDAFFGCSSLTIRCASGSYAENYARSNGINIYRVDKVI